MTDDGAGGPGMDFFGHLDELRKRLFYSALALVIATLVASIFAGEIIKFLLEPYGQRLQTLGPTENVITYFRVALMAGAVVAVPFMIYQLLFGFISPGMTENEKRWIKLSLPFSTLLFIVGILFAWYVMVPAAINFLVNFQKDIFRNEWTAREYIGFVVSIAFWIGVAFQTPLVTFILAKLNLVTPRFLVQNWRIAIVIAAVVAAIITPTVDPFNMALMMLPLLVLYGLSIILAVVAVRTG